MAPVLLNGREPVDWAPPALERGRRHELEREDPPPCRRTELLPPLGTL